MSTPSPAAAKNGDMPALPAEKVAAGPVENKNDDGKDTAPPEGDENSQKQAGDESSSSNKKKRSRSESNCGGSDDDDDVSDAKPAAKSPAKSKASTVGPKISGGVIDFPLGPVAQRLTCPICNGYFREPFTIAECLHTFCKRCLFFSFNNGDRHCPTCDVNLNPDPYRECLADRTIESIVDKLFPQLKEADAKAEKEFYERRGIKLKREFREAEHDLRKSPTGKGAAAGAASGAASPALQHDEVDFRVIPDTNVDGEHQMPPLEMSSLRASGNLKVASIKKFLIMKLKLQGDVKPSAIEICCNGGPVGDELNLTFISRTRWIHTGEEIVLTYRYGEEGMFG